MALALDTRPRDQGYPTGSGMATPSSARDFTFPSPCMDRALSSPRKLSITEVVSSLSPGRELPMPAVRSSCTLVQAEATLQLCSNRLKNHFRRLIDSDHLSIDTAIILAEMRRYQSWLEQWEMAFSAQLAVAMPTMTQVEIKKCRVIKANHLSTSIMASIAGVKESDFEPFLPEFRAIIGLAAATLEADNTPDISPKSIVDKTMIAATTEMTIADPLRVTVYCCNDPLIRSRASKLLHHVS
jgi:hypothetical protein